MTIYRPKICCEVKWCSYIKMFIKSCRIYRGKIRPNIVLRISAHPSGTRSCYFWRNFGLSPLLTLQWKCHYVCTSGSLPVSFCDENIHLFVSIYLVEKGVLRLYGDILCFIGPVHVISLCILAVWSGSALFAF